MRPFEKLKSKRVIWTKTIRLYTDGGQPKFTLLPGIRKQGFHSHWGLCGFVIYWLGREFNFVFGKDINGLYK